MSKPKFPRSLKRPLMLSAWLLTSLLLASCVSAGRAVKPPVVDNGCAAFRPIYVSLDDVLTDGTAQQILAHNEVGARLCGWSPNAPPK